MNMLHQDQIEQSKEDIPGDIIGNCPNCDINPIFSLKTNLGVKIEQSLCDQCLSERIKEREKEEKQDKIDRLYHWSNLPSIAPSITFEKMFADSKENKKLITTLWHGQIKKNTVLPYIYGVSGVGKTYLAYCLANRVITQQNKYTYFINIPSTLWEYKTEKPSHPPWALISILIIDDLWNHIISNWALEFIYEIIDTRIRHGLATLITSNISPFDLNNHLFAIANDTASSSLIKCLTDRIFELCTPIEMKGNSKRIELALTRKLNEHK